MLSDLQQANNQSNQMAPVTPPPQFGNQVMLDQQSAMSPLSQNENVKMMAYQTSMSSLPQNGNMGMMVQQPASESLQQPMVVAANPFAAALPMDNQPQPVIPSLRFGSINLEEGPVTSPPSTSDRSSFGEEGFDFGPPMGSPVEGIKLSEIPTSTAIVPATQQTNHYESNVNCMGTITPRIDQPSPEQIGRAHV